MQRLCERGAAEHRARMFSIKSAPCRSLRRKLEQTSSQRPISLAARCLGGRVWFELNFSRRTSAKTDRGWDTSERTAPRGDNIGHRHVFSFYVLLHSAPACKRQEYLPRADPVALFTAQYLTRGLPCASSRSERSLSFLSVNKKKRKKKDFRWVDERRGSPRSFFNLVSVALGMYPRGILMLIKIL